MKRTLAIATMLACGAACAAFTNRDYCRVTNGGAGIEYAPSMLAPLMSVPTAEQYRAAGWLKNAVVSAPVSNGYHVASVRYEARGDAVFAVYVYEKNPAPVYRYSKLKLIVAAKAANKWETLKTFVKNAGLEDEFLACQFFEDGYPAFVAGTNAVVQSGLATDAEVRQLLEASRDE